MLGFVEHFESFRPLLAAHVDDAQVGVGSGELRVERERPAEGMLGFAQLATGERILPVLKELRGIGSFTCRWGLGSTVSRVSRRGSGGILWLSRGRRSGQQKRGEKPRCDPYA